MKALRISAQIAATLGLLSITLTGEIAPSWLAASWIAWLFSLIGDRYPQFIAKLRHFETVAVAGMIMMFLIDFLVFRFSIFIAITHFLLLFQIFKLAGAKARKDCLQIFLFSFFQILAACTLSVDAWHAAILLGLIPTATALLFWNQIEREWEQAGQSSDPTVHRHYRRMATGICLAAFPSNVLLTIAVFVIFPRLKLNASLPGFSGHRTGFTDQMNLAQKGNLRQNSSVVLWLNFPKAEERAAWTGYLQGEVLSHFDGRQWSSSKERGSRMILPDPNGIFLLRPQHSGIPLIHQTITLADTSAATLFAIARPVRIRAPLPALQQSEGGSFHWLASWNRPLRYEVASESLSEMEDRPVDNPLPAIPLARIRDLAQRVAGTGPSQQQAQNIELYLSKTYRYSTDFGDRVPENPVDYFLFERREGSCAHFASAMALMLRLRNIPSRLVAGYFKGEWNDPAQCIVMRERDAHAWVEAYIEGQGWVAFDPTPSSTPGFVSHRSVLNRLEQYWDYLDFQWNRFVIQYDLYAQIKAFETMKGGSERLGSTLIRWWPDVQFRSHHRERWRESASIPFKKTGVFVFLTLASFLLLAQKRRASTDATIRFYSRFLEQMSRTGHPKAPHETGREFVARLEQAKPPLGDLAHQVTEMYYQIRFRKEPS